MKLGLPKWLNDGYYKYIYVYNYPDMVKVNPIICHNTVDGKKNLHQLIGGFSHYL